MPPRSQLDAPEVYAKTLLRDDWTPGNVANVTPEFVHGWLGDGDQSDTYTVSIGNPEESPIRGGETGYSGIRPDGTGPIQTIDGTITVNAWSSRGWEGVNGTSGNPRKIAFLLKREVEATVQAHYNGTDAQGNATSFDQVAPVGSRRFVEDADEPAEDPIYRYEVTIGYGYHAEPA